MLHQIRTCLVFALTYVVLTSTACGQGRLKSIEISTDVTSDGFTAINVRDVFDSSVPMIHGVVKLEDVRANSVLKGAWISVDAISEPDFEIDSIEMRLDKDGPASCHVSLSRPNKGWPQGNYRLDVYLENRLIGSKRFSIKASEAGLVPKLQPVASPHAVKKGLLHA